MIPKSTLKNAIENEDWNGFIEHVESVCKNDLKYRRVESCHCVENPPDSKVKELQEKVDRFYERFHRQYPIRDDEILYTGHVNCVHFSDSKKDRGYVFIIEGYEETTGGIRRAFKEGLSNGIEYGKIARRQKTGLIGIIKRVYQDRQNISRKVKPVIELGIVTCYAYGNNYEGEGSLLDFECPLSKSWRTKLKIPKETVLKVY